MPSGLQLRERRSLARYWMRLARLALALLSTYVAPAEQAGIRVDVTLVRAPFVATDRDGKPIHDLRIDELSVTEDGVPQQIKYLWTELDQPLTVAMVIDISSSQMGFVEAHRQAVERFIQRVIGPSDRILLATVDEQPRLLVDLTSSTTEALRGAALIRQQRHAGELLGEPCVPPKRMARVGTAGCGGTTVWDGVFHIVRSKLMGAEERKALILLSDGLDLHASVHGLSSAIEASETAGVPVYTIRYLSAPYLALGGPFAIRAVRDKGMEQIATQTGGLSFKNPKDMDRVYAQIEEDLRNQYVLAYTPKQPSAPGDWHRLEVQTTRPGVRIRARAAYRAP